jgi:hypothetical protein
MPRETGGQVVEREFLTVPVWDFLDAQTAETVARTVERCLPEPWKFVRLAWHECADQNRHVAFYSWKEFEFALVPGGAVTLGYDPKRPPPPAGLLSDWAEEVDAMVADYPDWKDMTWERYLGEVLSPLRQVELPPYLIAMRGESKRNATGMAERKAIAKEGFTLPTADQWEFACSAGSRAAWHWGDDPTGGPPERNAFGLVITQNSYCQEVLDEPDHFRGGDGGTRAHGGCRELESVVPLSSWFRARGVNDSQEDWWEYTLYRRVWVLPESMFG